MKKQFLALFAAITVCFAPLSYAATRTGVSQSRTTNDSENTQRRDTQQRTTTKRTTPDSENTQRRATQSRSTIQRVGATNNDVTNRATATMDTTARTATRPTNTIRSATTARTATKSNTTARTATTRSATRPTTTARTATKPNISRAGVTVNNRNVVENVMSREELNKKTEMTEYCREQYASCMDQYCNILDEDMARCSCSANISNYEKTSKGLEQANAALQDVAQQIQYIGLSADDINTLFSETEAESAMASVSDSTQLKNDLDKIKKMIVDVKPGSADNGSTTTSGLNLNLSGLLSFSFDDSDFSLDSIFGNQNSTTGNIINQRGTTLHKTATQRCQTAVLTYCKDNGVDTAEVINSYDLKITKDCIAYEQTLDDQNKNMASTIRNANNVLQKARLMVRQNKNKYDLRGCVTALDECMRTDFVCGEDYENCLDPSGKYIVNGEVVLGSTPNLDSMWQYDGNNTPWTTNGLLADYIEEHTWTKKPTRATSGDIAEFLQYKIGYKEGENNYGLCMGVLNQCQDYTYDKTNGTYIYGNTVVHEYLTRILPTIKTAQDKILNEFATNCVTDVTSCLNTNGYATSTSIATNACKSMITTCMSATSTTTTTSELNNWVTCLMKPETENCNNIQPDPGTQGDDSTTYTITYVLNSGTGCSNDTYTAGATKTLCTTATKDGYTFKGWYTTSDFSGSALTSIPTGSTGDKTFYAKWAGGESPFTPDAITCDAGEYYKFAVPSFSGGTTSGCETCPEGYYCPGGNYNKLSNKDQGMNKCPDGTTSSAGATSETQCVAGIYEVELDFQGGSGESATRYVYEKYGVNWYLDSKATLPMASAGTNPVIVPTRTGYNFNGYWTEATGGVQAIQSNGVKVTNFNSTLFTDNNGKLYAHWKETAYTITYELNDGTGCSNDTYTAGTTKELCTPTKDGYTFAGWYDNGLFTGDAITQLSATDTGDKTFYAKWVNENCRAVVFDANGGHFGNATHSSGTQKTYYTIKSPASLTLYTDENCRVLLDKFDRTALHEGTGILKDGKSFLRWGTTETVTTSCLEDKSCKIFDFGEEGSTMCKKPSASLPIACNFAGIDTVYAQWGTYCEPGTYYKSTHVPRVGAVISCEPCEAGNYCPGGVFSSMTGGSIQGSKQCPDGTTSPAGASSEEQCEEYFDLNFYVSSTNPVTMRVRISDDLQDLCSSLNLDQNTCEEVFLCEDCSSHGYYTDYNSDGGEVSFRIMCGLSASECGNPGLSDCFIVTTIRDHSGETTTECFTSIAEFEQSTGEIFSYYYDEHYIDLR